MHGLIVGFQPIDAVSSGPDGDDVLRADIVDIETGGSPPHTRAVVGNSVVIQSHITVAYRIRTEPKAFPILLISQNPQTVP